MEVQNNGNENSLTNSFLKISASFLSHNANALEANVNNAHDSLHWIGPGIVRGLEVSISERENLAFVISKSVVFCK